MKTILTALAAAATLAFVIPASSGAGLVEDFVAGAIVGNATADERPAYVAVPDPGYIVYSGDAAALPGPSCYWTRMPVYDSDRTVIGWRGRPVAVCPPPRVSSGAATGN
jgi:hypothetical protein